MKCPECQAQQPDSQKFCGECGTKLETPCPSCSYRNPLHYKFCGECGQSLKERQEALERDYSKPQSYTPKHLADKILTTRSSMAGERKLVSVM
jgi:NADH pyrophosphatase NudC (nudix superfamily)